CTRNFCPRTDTRKPEFVPELLPRTRRLMLLVNPCGGRGNALQQCQSHILPMLTEAEISYNLIQTERQNHARELVQGISLEQWDGIIVISGDGLLYEVINGLMERPDWEDAIKMPVGILPCGSGNALAGAINYNAGYEHAMGSELLLNCILLLCRGTVIPMDLVSLTTCSGIRSFSFLSVAWGFISDVDIESEKYRHMGSARFTVGTMVRVASLRTYRGRLSYLPVLDAHRPICRSITLHHQVNGPKDDLLPSLGQPLPKNWIIVEDNFVLVLAIYQSHLGADLFTAPFSTFDDGLIHLFFVKAGISRAALVRLFLAMEKGTHFETECPYLTHIPVRAFRLEPLTRKGIITVDGERVEYGPIQAQIHKGLSNLITGSCKVRLTPF
uniref:Sphingosine kinase 1 n=1 Tax=Xenopus tropicalis TaxID=8364 RepID=A0A803KCE5_XENTR